MIYLTFPTDRGRFAVRPANWAFESTRGVVSEDIRHTAIFEDAEDALDYLKYKEAKDSDRLFILPEGVSLSSLDHNAFTYAFIHALSLVKYSANIPPEGLGTATAMCAELSQAYRKGVQDERDRLALLEVRKQSSTHSSQGERRY